MLNRRILSALLVLGSAPVLAAPPSDEVLRKADDLWTGRREGWLLPLVDSVRPFTEAASAQGALESRASVGKLLLSVAGD